MAISGKLNTSAWKGNNGTRYLELSWERTAIDVEAQTSTIKWTLTSRGTYTGYVMSAPFRVYIDGSSVYSSETRIKLYTNQQVATGTKTIKHNTDGTKTFAASVSAALYLSSINSSGSDTFTLDLVGMATITKAPNFNDEENPIIEYYNPVGTAISSLQAAISLTGETPDIAYRDTTITGSTYTFNLTDAERKVLRAATQGSNSRKVRFYLRNVVNDNIYFSWKEVNYTVINANPTVEATVVDVNTNTISLTGDNTTLIRYHSTAQATIDATAYKEATIKTTSIEHNGTLSSDRNKLYLNVEGNTFAFIAADSRGNTATKTIVAPMIDYVKPTANIDAEQQLDTNGVYKLMVSGNYFNDTFGFTSAAAANTLTLQYRYKAQGGTYGSWASMTATKSGNTYNGTQSITGLDYRTTYIFQCRIIDKLNTVLSAEMTVKSLPVFHWSESDFVFEVPVYFNAGSDGAMAGSWKPTLTTAAAVSSYSVQQGWYQKIGNVITIGWQIKADIKTGYSGTALAIGGCPFTPTYAAFGGGIAHNIYLTGGFCFEGWGIGTDGLITYRGQPCNNTAAGNLQINSTAYYPTGTSNTTITLAGTITFTIGY